MKIHELAKKTGMSNKELLKETGLKSHMSKVSSDVVAQYLGEEKKTEPEQVVTETVDVGGDSEVVKPVVVKECPVSLEILELSKRGAGGKSPLKEWFHLLEG